MGYVSNLGTPKYNVFNVFIFFQSIGAHLGRFPNFQTPTWPASGIYPRDLAIFPIFQQNPLLEENVKITHVSTCWRCREAFASVQNAALTIFQQMLGVS